MDALFPFYEERALSKIEKEVFAGWKRKGFVFEQRPSSRVWQPISIDPQLPIDRLLAGSQKS
jgi:hypothetical protein